MRGVYFITVVLTGMIGGPARLATISERCRNIPPWGLRRANGLRGVNTGLRLSNSRPDG